MSTSGRRSEMFVPHGQFDAYVYGQLVISEVTGPWNKELVEAWAQALQPVVDAVCEHGPHIGIAVIRRSILCPPDALDGRFQDPSATLC